jgi:hypothetical protein
LTSAAAPTEGVLLKARHCCLDALRIACLDTAENILIEVQTWNENAWAAYLQDM